MELAENVAVVTGGASGLGHATATVFAARGCRVAVLDRDAVRGEAAAAELDGFFAAVDVVDEASAGAAIAAVEAHFGAPARILVNCAGIAIGQRTVAKGGPHSLADFERVIRVNLVGTFNMARLVAARLCAAEPLPSGERGVLINTASVAAFDGQIGQVAYAASKAAVHGMTLPLARDLSDRGVRVCTIAPGIFLTPMMAAMPAEVQQSLAAAVPFPQRLGDPAEFAATAAHIVTNAYLNGETIRLDGAIRMAPR